MTKFFVMLTVMLFAIFWMFTDARAEVFITVDKSRQEMIVETPLETFRWDVSTGRKGFNTPSGNYQPYMLKKLHYSKKYDNAPMPYSIFYHGGYAIHATGDVERLGNPASHGCIRLELRNARWLYRIVQEYGEQNTYITVTE